MGGLDCFPLIRQNVFMNEWDIAINALKTHGKFIVFGMICGLGLAVIVTLLQKPVWQAEMVVGPSGRTSVPSLSALLPQTAADAPALQYFVKRIDAAQSTDFTRFETLLNAPQTIKTLQQNKSLSLPYTDLNKTREWVDNNLKIRPLGLTPYRKVVLRHHDAQLALSVLQNLYTIADQAVRQDAQLKTNRRITYLKGQLETVRNPDHRNAIIALLKEQEQTAMMVSIDNSFAAEIIQQPSLLPKPVAPKAVILFPLFFIAGACGGLLLSGFIKALKK